MFSSQPGALLSPVVRLGAAEAPPYDVPSLSWSQRRKPSEAVVRCCDTKVKSATRPSGFRSETDLGASDREWAERRRGGSCHRTVPDVLGRHAHVTGHVLRCVRKAVRRHPRHRIGHTVGTLTQGVDLTCRASVSAEENRPRPWFVAATSRQSRRPGRAVFAVRPISARQTENGPSDGASDLGDGPSDPLALGYAGSFDGRNHQVLDQRVQRAEMRPTALSRVG